MSCDNCELRNVIIVSTTSDLLTSFTDLELLFIANSELASHLMVKLNLKSGCDGTVGGKLFCFAFNRLPKTGCMVWSKAGFWVCDFLTVNLLN